MLNIRRIHLPILFSLAVLPGVLSAQEDKPGIRVIDPDKRVPVANAAARDTESLEFGISAGFLSVEDFNTNHILSGSLRYYFSEKYLLEGSIGISQTRRSATEEFEDREFLENRNFQYIAISGGYQLLKGRSFWGKRHKYNTGLYVIGGIEQVDFASNSDTGLLIGLSYKTVITDWLTINVDMRDHIVERDLFGDDKITQNTELLFGINSIF